MKQHISTDSFWSHTSKHIATRPSSGQPSSVARTVTNWLPPHLFVILSMLSVQTGAAFAKNLFPIVGSSGTVFLRLSFASLLFLAIARPRLRGYTTKDYLLVACFGITIATMNGFFYASITRLPLGIATTLEFSGPLAVTLIASRRLRDVLWSVFATAGVILLAPIQGANIDGLGVAFALLAGASWGIYILLNMRVGRIFPGNSGLAIAMSIGTLAFAPFSISQLHIMWQQPSVLFLGLIVAILSTVIPFALELSALRRLSAQAFGILLSLEPVIAALIGLAILREAIGLRAIIAIGLIVLASSGASFRPKNGPIAV